jgi:predicted N-acetyltransferase YhbS
MRRSRRLRSGCGESIVNEPLRLERFDQRKHDRSRFDFGVAELNAYLRTSVGQHGRRDLTHGYVLETDGGKIAGSFTFAAGRLQVSVRPEPGRLPTRMPLPTTLLARLAVDRGWQGKGIGGGLLVHALRIAVTGADTIAAAVIEFDAKDEAAKSFYGHFGFRSLEDNRLHIYLPMETARTLIQSIRK